jgi:hypothetical protein
MPYNGPRSSYRQPGWRRRYYAGHQREISTLKAVIKELRWAIKEYRYPPFGNRQNIQGSYQARARAAVSAACRLANSYGSTQIPQILSLRTTLDELLNESDRYHI